MAEKKPSFLNRFFSKFLRDETTTLAASLAFYTALSLAPLLILFVTVTSQFSGDLQADFQMQVRDLVGDDAAKAIQMIIDSAKSRPDLTSLASLLGILTLLLSASLIFGELRSALNRIFEVRPHAHDHHGILREAWLFIESRVFHIGLAIGFIFALIASLIISSTLSASLGVNASVATITADALISVVFYILVFTAMFRYLPDHNLPWKCAIQGGAITAVLFVVGKQLISFYIGNSAIGSSYGAAGSVIVLLVWVYYSSIITFIGAQVSSLLQASRGAGV